MKSQRKNYSKKNNSRKNKKTKRNVKRNVKRNIKKNSVVKKIKGGSGEVTNHCIKESNDITKSNENNKYYECKLYSVEKRDFQDFNAVILPILHEIDEFIGKDKVKVNLSNKIGKELSKKGFYDGETITWAYFKDPYDPERQSICRLQLFGFIYEQPIMKNMVSLDISNNNLHNKLPFWEIYTLIGDSVLERSKLEYINLSNNNLDSNLEEGKISDTYNIDAALFKHRNTLKILDISNNNFTKEGLESLFDKMNACEQTSECIKTFIKIENNSVNNNKTQEIIKKIQDFVTKKQYENRYIKTQYITFGEKFTNLKQNPEQTLNTKPTESTKNKSHTTSPPIIINNKSKQYKSNTFGEEDF